ncbi:uncharacterized protein LOC127798134 [Diospyros lotus]|uniref:uncharacterized protein LOC127798134 n=1 Tax=Diospyros lotus TaxID=55363 RepID=UPI002257CEC0|nr:uncharacterized protein LOC127798134 [Diospyros lotus]
MGWKIWQQGWKRPFHLLTTTLLGLLLPLSFLLLARLSTAHYLFTSLPHPYKPHPSSLLISLFLSINPTIPHLLVSLISIATLIHALTGRFIVLPSKSTLWVLLCTLQVLVGLGIEGSIAAGIDGSGGFGSGGTRSILGSAVFFLGLHETMLWWSRTVVKPVVDDTVFGILAEEIRWAERVAMAAALGGLWWWRLRDEVESLVGMVEVKKELLVADFIGWWLYYLTVTIGMVRIVKAIMWFGVILLCSGKAGEGKLSESNLGNEDKV